MTVYFYGRNSDSESFEKGSSIETQKSKCNSYADLKNLTIDKEIKYRLINLNKNFKKSIFEDQSYVFEIKADINTNLSYLLNNFDFPRSRFSKYERALDSLLKWELYYKNYDQFKQKIIHYIFNFTII